MSAAKTETELKYRISKRRTFNALRELTHVNGFTLESIGSKTIIDQYLDTASRRVLQAGYACRLRHQKNTHILTLKSLAPASGALHRRKEIECTVPGKASASWPDSPAKTLLQQITGDEPLELLFDLKQTRQKYLVKANGQPIIELSLDEVWHGETAQADYLGLEAELINNGSEADLARFANQLEAQFPLQPESVSKFERMYAARFGRITMYNLTAKEKTQLETFMKADNETLTRRARLVLMSEAGESVASIAHEVGFALNTVKKYQREFSKKRMAFFPAPPPAETLPAEPSVAVAEVVATEPKEIAGGASSVVAEVPTVEAGVLQPEVIEPAAVETVGSSTTTATASAEEEDKEKKLIKKLKKKVGIIYPARKSIGLLATDSFAEAGRKVLSFHFARMLKYEPGTRLGSDIEELHDMRVATRRMRAAFNLFGPAYRRKTIKPLLAGLKATGRALGPVRDLDVFIEKLEQYQNSLLPEDQAQFEAFLDAWRQRRARARQKMLNYLDSKSYKNFKKSFYKFVTTSGKGTLPTKEQVPPMPQELRHVVPGLVYSAYDNVRAFETVLDSAPIETLHQLRISFKGLRYTLEFIEEVLGDGKEMIIAEVKALQDHLGDLNDADVGAQIIEDFLASWSKKQRKLTAEQRQSAAPLQAYLAEQVEKREQLLATFPTAWDRFNRVEFRQTLARTISML